MLPVKDPKLLCLVLQKISGDVGSLFFRKALCYNLLKSGAFLHRCLDLGRLDPVAVDLDHVIISADHVVEPVLVPAADIVGMIITAALCALRLLRMVQVSAEEFIFKAEFSLSRSFDDPVLLIHQNRIHPGHRSADRRHVVGFVKCELHHGKARFRATIGIHDLRLPAGIIDTARGFRACSDLLKIGTGFLIHPNIGGRKINGLQFIFKDIVFHILKIPELFFGFQKCCDPVHRIVDHVEDRLDKRKRTEQRP